jgi:NADH dehydrogenase [ubiquinone] 1 alpha subcomplex assembly factor 5
MSSAQYLFNRDHIDQFHKRSFNNFSKHNFLFEFARDEILDRLKDIKRDFKDKICLGNRISVDGFKSVPLYKFMSNHSEIVPLEIEQADCIINILDLHAINDLPNYLLQIRHALRPDGLFIAAMFGGETLLELRQSFMEAELKIQNGASPRVYPFADKPQMGILLQQAGFALPVIDSEIIRTSYQTMFNLIGDLRGMGENNALTARYKKFTPSSLFYSAAECYQKNFAEFDGRVTASFEIIFLVGWAPHSTQQQPQKRGSAQISLAEHLNETEIKI